MLIDRYYTLTWKDVYVYENDKKQVAVSHMRYDYIFVKSDIQMAEGRFLTRVFIEDEKLPSFQFMNSTNSFLLPQ